MAQEIEKTEVFLFAKYDDGDIELMFPERSEVLDSFLEWELSSDGEKCTTEASIKVAGLKIVGELKSYGENIYDPTIIVAILPYRLTRV